MTLSITQIKTQSNSTFSTGPMQFGTDWPGTFITLSYINSLIIEQDSEKKQPIVNALDFSKNYINGFLKEIIELKTLFENDNSSETISSSIQMIEVDSLIIDNDLVQRVETGIVQINNQIGYFIRGDNASYLLYMISLKKEPSDLETQMKIILSGCIV